MAERGLTNQEVKVGFTAGGVQEATNDDPLIIDFLSHPLLPPFHSKKINAEKMCSGEDLTNIYIPRTMQKKR